MKLTSRNGKLWITFYHQSQRCRRSLNLDDTKTNRKLATSQIIPEIVYKLNQGMFFEEEKVSIPLLKEYADISFKMHQSTRKESTMVRMNSNYKRHILTKFGDKQIDKIRPSDISLWQNDLLADGLSPKRIRDIRSVLSVIMSDAVHDELIDSNPVSKVLKLPFQKSAEIIPFSFDEIQKILKVSEGHFRNLFAVGFFTGLRTGELIGLKWSDINFTEWTLSVNCTVGRGSITSPKTVGSIREIEILDVLKPYLLEQFERTGSEKSFIFLNEANTHYFDPSKVRDPHWKKALKKAGVEYRTIYHMRHTFASMMISNGENILWVSSTLGHTTPEMTLKRYTRYIKKEGVRHGTFLNTIFS